MYPEREQHLGGLNEQAPLSLMVLNILLIMESVILGKFKGEQKLQDQDQIFKRSKTSTDTLHLSKKKNFLMDGLKHESTHITQYTSVP